MPRISTLITYPTDFVVGTGKLFYVDCECSGDPPQREFERWGVQKLALIPSAYRTGDAQKYASPVF